MNKGDFLRIVTLLACAVGTSLLIMSPTIWAGPETSATGALLLQPTQIKGQPGSVTIVTGLGIHAPVAIAFAPTHPEVIYAGAQDGLARSTDGGQSWHLVGTGLLYPRKIVVDPSNPQVLYACRRPLPNERGIAVPGVFKSTDGGFSWKKKDRGLGKHEIWSLAIDPQRSYVLYAGSRDGLVFKSTDAGEKWTMAGQERPALEGSPPRTVIDLLVHPITGDLYAVEDTVGVFKSSDEGRTWVTVHRSSGSLILDWRSGTLYLAGRNLWKSSDGGGSWEDISGNLPRDTRKWSHQITWAGINPEPLVLYVQQQYQTIYRSTDGGKNWTPLDIRQRFVPRMVKPGPQPVLYGATPGALASYADVGIP